MSYVDGFVLCVPEDNLKAYTKMAKDAGKIWMEHGAVNYVECLQDDLDNKGMGMPFSKLANPKKGEVIVFSYIVYQNKKHRDQVNKKVMADKRMQDMPKDMPFDCNRMAYGGFKSIVEY